MAAESQAGFGFCKVLSDMRPLPKDVIGFHRQQAVEKALKAYLVSLEIRTQKIHALYRLLELCEGNERVGVFTEEAIALNDYSLDSVTEYLSARVSSSRLSKTSFLKSFSAIPSRADRLFTRSFSVASYCCRIILDISRSR